MPKEQADLALRKRMRKGTHSCFECRRRKIRCIYPPDNSNVCSECFARGSRCIDQEHANPDVVVDHRKNLRERVSRLEALVDSLLEDKIGGSQTDTNTSFSKTPNLATRDTFPPTPLSSEAASATLPPTIQQRAPSDRGHHIPILSVFEDALNDAEVRMKVCGTIDGRPTRKESSGFPGASIENRFTVTHKNIEDMMDENSTVFTAKRERAKQALLATLPPYDQLQKVLNSNSDWWQTWRRKCCGTSDPNESLPQFASKALDSGNIGAIGILVLSVGICLADEGDVDNYIEAVDRYVVSDDEYAATLEGMECLILKAKWYADIGQPRRAWISYRKGLMYTQLMGLHRQRTSSAAHESIWWSLYHGDRFLSLLLGLPYGIMDSHCDLSLPDMGGPYLAPLVFMNKVLILAGKVIDRNQGVAEQSFAWALQLDQELEDLWKQLDPAWLEYSGLMADLENNAAELRERLMAQMMYHQIRVYLHLPFMLKSQSNSRFAFSRTACLNGSREVMRLYQASRTGGVQPLYECKAVDFIVFTAAVLLMLGLYNYGAAGDMTPKDQEADIRLVEMSIDIFRRASSEKGGKVALQSAEVLERMLKKFSANGDSTCNNDDMTDFVIPYFGTISIRQGARKAGPPNNPEIQRSFGTNRHNAAISSLSPSQRTPSSSDKTDPFSLTLSGGRGATANTSPERGPSTSNFDSDPFVSYEGFYNWPSAPEDIPNNANANPASSTDAMASSAAGLANPSSHVNDDSMTNFPLPTNNFSWQNMPMDIDQDWNWFLNDGSTGSQMQPGGGGGGGTQLGNAFSQHTYAGFG